MADQVKFGADATDYFQVINQMQAKLDELSVKTQRTGRSGQAAFGFARDEKVATNMRELAASLASGAGAADLLAIASFRVLNALKGVGLGVGVGAAIGIGLFTAFKKARDEAYALDEEIRKVLASASGPASYSSIDELNVKLQKIREETEKVQTEANAPFKSLLQAIAAHPNLTPGQAVAAQNEERTRRSAELLRSEQETLSKIAEKMSEVNDIEDERQHVSQNIAALAKLDLEYEEKRAALIRGPGQNLGAVAELDRQHALERQQLERRQALEQASTVEQIKQARIGANRLESLKEEVEFTKQLYQSTAGRSIEETLAAQADYEKAVAALKEATFQNQQQVTSARETNHQLELQRDGYDVLAQVEKDIADAEQTRVQYLHQGNRELAEQAVREGELRSQIDLNNSRRSLIEQQGRYEAMSPQEKYRQYFQDLRQFEAMKRAAEHLGLNSSDLRSPRFGEPYDPFGKSMQEKVQELFDAERKAREAAELGRDQNAQPYDTSGIKSLIGADFSSLKSLDGADFSGLQSLNGLAITIQ